jgi:hypothetical protein
VNPAPLDFFFLFSLSAQLHSLIIHVFSYLITGLKSYFPKYTWFFFFYSLCWSNFILS